MLGASRLLRSGCRGREEAGLPLHRYSATDVDTRANDEYLNGEQHASGPKRPICRVRGHASGRTDVLGGLRRGARSPYAKENSLPSGD